MTRLMASTISLGKSESLGERTQRSTRRRSAGRNPARRRSSARSRLVGAKVDPVAAYFDLVAVNASGERAEARPSGGEKTAVSSGNSTRSAQDGHSAKPSRADRGRERAAGAGGCRARNCSGRQAPRGSLRSDAAARIVVGPDPGHAVAGPLPKERENFLGGEALHRFVP